MGGMGIEAKAKDRKLDGALRLLAEKLDMTPAEFAEATIVIRGGQVEVLDQEEVDDDE